MKQPDKQPILQFKHHHIGVAVSSIEQALPVYADVFGYRILSGPYRDPIQRVSVCFVGTGQDSDSIIELVAPNGENSPVGGVLSKGIGAYHVCYEVRDLDFALSYVRQRGCLAIGKPVPAVAFNGRRIAWLLMPTRQLVELLEADGAKRSV